MRSLALIVSGTRFGRPFTTTPGTSEDRVRTLRAVFAAVMRDRDFLGEAASLNFDVAPIAGEALEKIAGDVVGTPKELAARAKPFLE